MDQIMFDAINELVGHDDTLYILGDFCFRGKKPIDYRLRINCRDVHLIFGNHDKRTDYYPDDKTVDMNGFTSIQDIKEIVYCNQRIFLSHYPHRSWPDKTSNRLTLDVGVDNTVNYNKPFGQPWSFKEIQQLFNKKNRKYET